MAPPGKQQTIAWDFDGTIHPYTDGWVGHTPADEPPIEGVREMMAELHEAGYRQVVFSCRADCKEGMGATIAWLMEHDLDGYIDEVTDRKPAAIAYIDDRAVSFRGDWADVRTDVDRLASYHTGGRVHSSNSR